MSALVFCRIGSLEIGQGFDVVLDFVFCRIGSLEIFLSFRPLAESVFCHIGSLENTQQGGLLQP